MRDELETQLLTHQARVAKARGDALIAVTCSMASNDNLDFNYEVIFAKAQRFTDWILGETT